MAADRKRTATLLSRWNQLIRQPDDLADLDDIKKQGSRVAEQKGSRYLALLY